MTLLEEQSQAGQIDLFYGDETQVSEEGYVPYGWQFKGEDVAVAAARGAALNCFGLLSRDNDFIYAARTKTITADFIIEQLDRLSWQLTKHTVVVLDNARVHQNGKVRAMQSIWARRGLFIFFLPPYSPHLNIIERLWKELKTRWLRPQDYVDKEQLFYSLNLILNAIGKDLTIKFKPFNINLN